MLLTFAPCFAIAGGGYRGVNISGAEINAGTLPGRVNFDYVYPTPAQLRLFAGYGMNAVRVPVLWERLQPELGRPLDAAELKQVESVLDAASAVGLTVVVDLHDYGSYRGHTVGSSAVPVSAFADLWKQLAVRWKRRDGVIFGLMNEPHGIDTASWARADQAAIDAIRAAGARQLILASGVGWDGAHNFVSGSSDGPPNAPALSALHDPSGHLAIELHQYLDSDSSGTHDDCRDPSATVASLAPATEWLRAHHQLGFLGEFAAARSDTCLKSLDAMLSFMDSNADVWIGWTYWAAGAWWGDYRFSVEPKDGHDAPQMAVLRRHIQTRS